ncbi:FkbM family methyltransferase [Flavobacterium sp. IMCC34852]|uniref:FkbM family methyltransferase n=1 Tax=Flavobacterium rivulicola TaxID=2732161 RepID=A0A7Y3R737_9FLAO|nr:FkbM family methyltransferase [Flavobacterium sp. IMCC34852]NNT71051.1 FkbM family methyltransferase [Flavobacterium sp. IMCC34852]
MKYSTVLKQIFIVAKSNWFFYFIRGKVFSFSSFEIVSNLKRTVPVLDYIIDVGANSGQFSKVASYHFPKAKMDVFEPLPNLFPRIKKMFDNNPNINTHNIALGNELGTIKFNQNEFGHISSILEISDENIHYPKGNGLDQIDVQIKTLDSFSFSQKANKGIALLKLDVQGYELEVLKGGENTLQHIDYILLEANLEQLYVNQPSFTEVNSYLNSKGFELSDMLDFNLGSKNKYIEIDLLYKRV